MLTGMLAVRNALYGENNDLWVVNAEQDYHEEIRTGEIPEEEAAAALEKAFERTFLRLDPLAFGSAWGIVVGLGLFLITLLIYLAGWQDLEAFLWPLSQFLPGYGVTPLGSFPGLLYGFIGGFIFGGSFALMKNAAAVFTIMILRNQAEFSLLIRTITQMEE